MHRIVVSHAVLHGRLRPGAARNGDESAVLPENDIITYEPVDFNKTVITIGTYAPCNSDPVELAIEAQFPDVDIVVLEQASIPDIQTHVRQPAVQRELEDIIFTGYLQDMEVSDSIFYDLSAEDFTSLYNQSVLNNMSSGGRLYQLPINSSIQGIFYNKSLFESYGWEIPETIDAFYKLCDEISAQGIRPFVPCFKYSPDGVGLGFSNRAIFPPWTKESSMNFFAAVKPPARACWSHILRCTKRFMTEAAWWTTTSLQA